MDSKSLLASKSFQGAFVAILPGIGQALEVLGVVDPGAVSDIVAAAVTVAGGLWSIYGTLVRKTRIRSLFF